MTVSERYFNDTNFFFKVLRTLNLLEPGRAVVSLSKAFLIIMMFIMIWITVFNPEHIVALVTASGSTALALFNYMLRRKQHIEHGIGVGEVIPTDVSESGNVDASE